MAARSSSRFQARGRLGDVLKPCAFRHFGRLVIFSEHFRQRLLERYQVYPSMDVMREINLRRHEGEYDLLEWRVGRSADEGNRQLLAMTMPGIEREAVVIYSPEENTYVTVLTGTMWLRRDLKRRKAPMAVKRKLIKQFEAEGL